MICRQLIIYSHQYNVHPNYQKRLNEGLIRKRFLEILYYTDYPDLIAESQNVFCVHWWNAKQICACISNDNNRVLTYWNYWHQMDRASYHNIVAANEDLKKIFEDRMFSYNSHLNGPLGPLIDSHRFNLWNEIKKRFQKKCKRKRIVNASKEL